MISSLMPKWLVIGQRLTRVGSCKSVPIEILRFFDNERKAKEFLKKWKTYKKQRRLNILWVRRIKLKN